MEKYDVGILGAGVAGSFAALRLTTQYPNIKSILFDLGRPPGKRRRQLEGWLGCLPASDGKIYPGDLDNVIKITDKKAKLPYKWVIDTLTQINSNRLITDSSPSAALQKKINQNGFQIHLNDHYQWKPEHIHSLSKYISQTIDQNNNLKLSFDDEVYDIDNHDDGFIISTNSGQSFCKKILICVGRSGWRWVNKLYQKLGLSSEDNHAYFGLRLEMSAQHLKELNKSHCTLSKNKLTLGPFSWNGTVIPEDHADLVISSFRSNEERWRTERVSFSLLEERSFPQEGIHQTDRLAKLAFLLSNDRIAREKIKSLIKGKSQLCYLSEYAWLIPTLEELNDTIFPNLISRGYFYTPDIKPICSKIKLSKTLESNIPGLFVAGESSGIHGIIAAAVTGTIAIDNLSK